MDVVGTLVTQGGFGIIAGIFLWLFLQERKEHREDRKTDQALIVALQDARLADTKSEANDLKIILEGNTQANRILSEKIEIAKAQGGVK